MIRVRWQEPSGRHFFCRYQDTNGGKVEEIREGDSRQEVENKLAKDVASGMIQAPVSVEPYDFAAWVKRAADATTAILKEPEPGKQRSFRQQVWKDLKPYLIHLFRGKCAYCEVSFLVGSWGDVEHYRPKGDVADLDDSPVIGHGGYYWLAYEPSNLLPSCEKCNRAEGKQTRFPVADPAKRVSKPADALTGEEPLFISPYEADLEVRHHFTWETTYCGKVPGMVRPLTPRADASIRGYHLNRVPLINARHDAQEKLKGNIMLALGLDQSLQEVKRQYADGRVPFSAAMLSQFEDWERRTHVTITL
jgi:hypothetical protein